MDQQLSQEKSRQLGFNQEQNPHLYPSVISQLQSSTNNGQKTPGGQSPDGRSGYPSYISPKNQIAQSNSKLEIKSQVRVIKTSLEELKKEEQEYLSEVQTLQKKYQEEVQLGVQKIIDDRLSPEQIYQSASSELQTQLDLLKKENELHNQMLQSYQSDISERDKKIKMLEDLMKTSMKQLQETGFSEAEGGVELDLKQKLQNLVEINLQQTDEISQLKSEIYEQKIENTGIISQTEQLQAQVEELSEKQLAFLEKIAEDKQNYEQKLQSMAEINQDLVSQKQNELDQVKQEIEVYRMRAEAAERDQDALVKKLSEQHQDELRRLSQESEVTLQEQFRKNQQLFNKVGTLQDEILEHKEENRELTKQLSQLTSEIEQQRSLIQDLKVRQSQMEVEGETQAQQQSNLKKKYNTLESDFLQISQLNSTYLDEKLKLEQQCSQDQNELNEIKMLNTSLTNQVENLKSELSKSASDLELAKIQIDNGQDQVRQMLQDNLLNKNELEEINKQQSLKIKELESRLGEQSAQETIRIINEHELHQMQEKNQQTEAQYQFQILALENNNKQLKEEFEELQKQLEKEQSAQKAAQGEVKRGEKQIEQLKKELEQAHQATSAKNTTESDEKFKKSMEDVFYKRLKQLSSEVAEQQAQMLELQQLVDTLQASKKDSKPDESASEAKELSNSSDQVIKSLQETVQTLTQEGMNSDKQWSAEVQTLKELCEKQKQSNLDQAATELQKSQEMQAHIEDLEKQLDQAKEQIKQLESIQQTKDKQNKSPKKQPEQVALEQQMKLLREQLKQMENDKVNTQQPFQAQLEEQKKLTVSLLSEKKQLESQNSKLGEKIKEITNEANKRDEIQKQLEEQMKEQQKLAEQKVEEIKESLEKQFQAKEQIYKDKLNKLSNKQQEMKDLQEGQPKKEVIPKKEEIPKKVNNQEQSDQISKLKAQVKEQLQNIESLKANIEKLKEQNSQLEVKDAKIKKLQNEITTLSKKVSSLQAGQSVSPKHSENQPKNTKEAKKEKKEPDTLSKSQLSSPTEMQSSQLECDFYEEVLLMLAQQF